MQMGQNIRNKSTKKIKSHLKSLILVSTPWPLYNRPSIQLGTLKAHLKSQFPDLQVNAHHFYLQIAEAIGYRLYQTISEKTWLAETVYAALLYPERLEIIKKIFYRAASGHPRAREVDFETLASRVEAVSEAFLRKVDWGTFGLAGFSVSFCQLTASLYFIRRIKRKFPDLPIVVGGSQFAAESIGNLFEIFPEIDAVVVGEGELPLCGLVRHFSESRNWDEMPSIPGIVTRKSENNGSFVTFSQMEDLAGLAPPDYDDYFDLLKTFGSEKTFFPILSSEISRGCWWRRQHCDGNYSGCAFCNLNLQWEGYRSKMPLQVASEIDHLTTKHKILSVAFMDNLLPTKASGEVFRQLVKVNKDLRLFGEIRASTSWRVLEIMRTAGMDEVQVGIEALSTRLLGKLNKGTTTIQNLEIMKNCETLGIRNLSNLILCFPGSDQQDVEETLKNMEFALPFRPLRAVYFWLGLGSPVWRSPRAFGIRAIFNHPNYAGIFPPDVSSSMRFIIQAYRGDRIHQKKLWQPVRKKLKAWKKAYAELHKGSNHSHILDFWDGRDFMIIRQKRLGADPIIHRLEGKSRAIYHFCQRHRSTQSIRDRFSGVAGDRIQVFLKMMVDKKLMFEEDEKYLSLAVPARYESL